MYLKSFFLSTLGNKKYNNYVYFFIKHLSCLIVFISTLSLELTIFYRRYYKNVHLKKSFRLINWLLNFSILKKIKINDISFDISSDLSIKDLFYLNNKLSNNKTKLTFDLKFDLLYINARIISIYAEKRDIKKYRLYLESFSELYNELIKNIQPKNTLTKKSKFIHNRKASLLLNEALKDFELILKDKNIFLAFGTLLGFIREGKILDHDLDIDVGYLYKNQKQFDGFVQSLKKNTNFKFLINEKIALYKIKNNQIQLTKIPSLITVAHKNGAHIDIFICHKIKNQIIFYAKHFCWKVTYFKTRELKILNSLSVNIPHDVNKYLVENYGNWKTRIIDYNFMRDSKNLGFTDNLSSVVSYTKSVFLNLNSSIEIFKHLESKKIIKNKNFNKKLFSS